MADLPTAPVKAQTVSIPLWKSAVVAGLLALTLFLCHLAPPLSESTTSGVVMTLPYQMGDWWGADQAISLAEKTILPSDTEFARKNYESGQGDSILCSIVLSGAEKHSIHRPEICLPGQGWTIHSSQVVSIPLHSGRVLQAMNLTLSRSVQLSNGARKEAYAYYLYWFVGDHITTPYHWKRIWLTSRDRVFHHVSHRWAYVIVNSLITDNIRPGGKNAAQTLEMMKRFVADVVPAFQKSEMEPVPPSR